MSWRVLLFSKIKRKLNKHNKNKKFKNKKLLSDIQSEKPKKKKKKPNLDRHPVTKLSLSNKESKRLSEEQEVDILKKRIQY